MHSVWVLFSFSENKAFFVLFPLTTEGPSCVRCREDFKTEFLDAGGKQTLCPGPCQHGGGGQHSPMGLFPWRR